MPVQSVGAQNPHIHVESREIRVAQSSLSSSDRSSELRCSQEPSRISIPSQTPRSLLSRIRLGFQTEASQTVAVSALPSPCWSINSSG
ncbi:hypothetical protein TNCV_2816471 [Trichonephila clavipes]|nr:hypothetical protein TNCV_2816471 [Trichonephila clavipes]